LTGAGPHFNCNLALREWFGASESRKNADLEKIFQLNPTQPVAHLPIACKIVAIPYRKVKGSWIDHYGDFELFGSGWFVDGLFQSGRPAFFPRIYF
jgi:hypothetical protein